MDFDQLETFLEVARTLSFSRAGEKRFRTQPAISSQIRMLEEEIGAKLFDRSGGKVALTTAGKAFETYVEETLEARRIMLASIGDLEREPRGEIVVSANEATCLHVLPEVFAEFKKRYPKIGVGIHRAEHAAIIEKIMANKVDLGVVSLPVRNARLKVVPLHRDELVIIVWPQHPLAAMRSASAADVARFPLLLPKVGRTRDALDDLFATNQLKPHVSMEIDSSELLKRFAAAGVGVGFIARSNVLEDVRAGALCAVPLSGAQIKRDLALVYRKDRALSRAATAFIDIAVQIKTGMPHDPA